jgi:hypothetical protein
LPPQRTRAPRPGVVRGLLLVALVCCGSATAEELALLGGFTDPGQTRQSYAWGLEYRQHLLSSLDASFAYLNEGHLPDHSRDGAVTQLWLNSGPWQERLHLAIGAGPYFYFDTRDAGSVAGYDDRHDVGLVLTGYASYSLSPSWFALMELNQIIAPHDGNTRTLMFGFGYRLDSFIEQFTRANQAHGVADVNNEVNVFVGQTVINDLHSERSTNFGVEYRHRFGRHVAWSAGYLNEADGPDGRNSGVTSELWLVKDFLSRQLEAGLGIGPYVALQRYTTADGRTGASVIGLASMSVSWRFTRVMALRFSWHRGITTDDQDRDILTAALAWRF